MSATSIEKINHKTICTLYLPGESSLCWGPRSGQKTRVKTRQSTTKKKNNTTTTTTIDARSRLSIMPYHDLPYRVWRWDRTSFERVKNWDLSRARRAIVRCAAGCGGMRWPTDNDDRATCVFSGCICVIHSDVYVCVAPFYLFCAWSKCNQRRLDRRRDDPRS